METRGRKHILLHHEFIEDSCDEHPCLLLIRHHIYNFSLLWKPHSRCSRINKKYQKKKTKMSTSRQLHVPYTRRVCTCKKKKEKKGLLSCVSILYLQYVHFEKVSFFQDFFFTFGRRKNEVLWTLTPSTAAGLDPFRNEWKSLHTRGKNNKKKKENHRKRKLRYFLRELFNKINPSDRYGSTERQRSIFFYAFIDVSYYSVIKND